jgi:hypothetical protein
VARGYAAAAPLNAMIAANVDGTARASSLPHTNSGATIDITPHRPR